MQPYAVHRIGYVCRRIVGRTDGGSRLIERSVVEVPGNGLLTSHDHLLHLQGGRAGLRSAVLARGRHGLGDDRELVLAHDQRSNRCGVQHIARLGALGHLLAVEADLIGRSVLHGGPRSGHGLLGTLVERSDVEGYLRSGQLRNRGLGGEVVGPGHLRHGDGRTGQQIDIVFAYQVAQHHLVGFAVGQHRIAVAGHHQLKGGVETGVHGGHLDGAHTLHADTQRAGGRTALLVDRSGRCEGHALGHDELGGSIDADVLDDLVGLDGLGRELGLVGEVPDSRLDDGRQLGRTDHDGLRGIPPAGVAGLIGGDHAVLQIHLTGNRVGAGILGEHHAAVGQRQRLGEGVAVQVDGLGGEEGVLIAVLACVQMTYVVIDVARAEGNEVLRVVAGHTNPETVFGLVVVVHVQEYALGHREGAGRNLADVEDTEVVGAGDGRRHAVEGTIGQLNAAEHLGLVLRDTQERTGRRIERGVLQDDRLVVAAADVDEVAAARAVRVDVVGIHAVEQEVVHVVAVGTRPDTLHVTHHLHVDELDVGHVRTAGRSQHAAEVGTVQHDLLEMERAAAGSGLQREALDDRHLTLAGSFAVDGEIAGHGEGFVKALVAHDGIGRHVVDRTLVIGQHQLHVAGSAVDGVVEALGRVDHVHALGVGTGPGGYDTARTRLAEQQGELVVATGIQSVHRNLAGTLLLVGQGNRAGRLALGGNDGQYTDRGQVTLVLGIVPGHRHGGGGTGDDDGVQQLTDGRRGDGLYQVGPVRRTDRSAHAADAGIEGLVHIETLDRIGNLVGSHLEGVCGGGSLVNGRIEDLHVLAVGPLLGGYDRVEKFEHVGGSILHGAPREGHVGTFGSNHFGLEVHRRQHPAVRDRIHRIVQIGRTGRDTHSGAERETEHQISEYSFHIFIVSFRL